MIDLHTISLIKEEVKNNVGNKVTLTAKKSRKKVIIKQGVIESVYPSIFVVKLDLEDNQIPSDRRVSYNYIDILTKNIEINLDNNNRRNIVGEIL